MNFVQAVESAGEAQSHGELSSQLQADGVGGAINASVLPGELGLSIRLQSMLVAYLDKLGLARRLQSALVAYLDKLGLALAQSVLVNYLDKLGSMVRWVVKSMLVDYMVKVVSWQVKVPQQMALRCRWKS